MILPHPVGAGNPDWVVSDRDGRWSTDRAVTQTRQDVTRSGIRARVCS
jgi:hypothetical protein